MEKEETNILVIEDDAEIARLVQINLEDEGYGVECIDDGKRGFHKIMSESYDLIILDLMLPGMNGIDICKEFRAENSSTPLLMLTAKSEEFDKVLGLELGADDYLTKPFSIRELVARVKALIRRTQKPAEQSAGPTDELISIGSLNIEPAKHKATLDDKSLNLTAKEFDLLTLFARNPGRAFTRQELLNEVWGYQFNGYEHTVNTHINRLRAKIEPDPSEPKYLKTVWGVGYRFTEKEVLSQ